MIGDPAGDPPVWLALRVYTRAVRAASAAARSTPRSRGACERRGAAGITTLRGEWGFSSDERPFGDRFGALASHVPDVQVLVDRPRKIASSGRSWTSSLPSTACHRRARARISRARRRACSTAAPSWPPARIAAPMSAVADAADFPVLPELRARERTHDRGMASAAALERCRSSPAGAGRGAGAATGAWGTASGACSCFTAAAAGAAARTGPALRHPALSSSSRGPIPGR